MSCTSPNCALVPKTGGSPVFVKDLALPAGDFLHPRLGPCRVVWLPCGGCIACRREKRQEKTLLQSLEASLFDDNWFLTLTYDDDKTLDLTGTKPYSLVRSHLASFNESMRKYCEYNGVKYRFFAVGEYGDKYERPHYHLSIFGLPPSILDIDDDLDTQKLRKDTLNDKARLLAVKTARTDSNGNFFWQSRVIADRWQFGNHQIYRANRETFQYVAGYCVKKLTGSSKESFLDTGRILPYFAQSRPSIGFPWFERYYTKIAQFDPVRNEFVNDSVEVGDISWKVPRIFERWLYKFLPKGEANFYLRRLKDYRSKGHDPMPDFVKLKSKSLYDQYKADRIKQENKHKEIN